MELDYQISNNYMSSWVIGIIVLQTDHVIEIELQKMINNDKALVYHTRIPCKKNNNASSLMEMENNICDAASMLPLTYEYNVIVYACTSASALIGEKELTSLISKVHPNAKVVTPFNSFLNICYELKIKDIALITPYKQDVNEKFIGTISSSGLNVRKFGYFNQKGDSVAPLISSTSLYNAVVDLGKHKEVQAVFLSCTDLNSLKIIESAEQVIKKPIITSNSAIAWGIARATSDEVLIVSSGPSVLAH